MSNRKQEAKDTLARLIKPGDFVYILIRKRSRRNHHVVDVLRATEHKTIVSIGADVAAFLDLKYDQITQGIVMWENQPIYSLGQNLSRALFNGAADAIDVEIL